jgi:hypothetical protein
VFTPSDPALETDAEDELHLLTKLNAFINAAFIFNVIMHSGFNAEMHK